VGAADCWLGGKIRPPITWMVYRGADFLITITTLAKKPYPRSQPAAGGRICEIY
jgi:hypothetical protein